MIRTVAPIRGKHGIRNLAQVEYEKTFAGRFDLVKDLPNFEVLERFAQKCIDLHCGDSLDGISARAYMDKVIAMSHDAFIIWATQYAQNSRS